MKVRAKAGAVHQMRNAGFAGDLSHGLASPYFGRHPVKSHSGSGHHCQHEEDAMDGAHRGPKRRRIIQVTGDESGACLAQQLGAWLVWVAYKGMHRPAPLK
jgi:hypothetical protein